MGWATGAWATNAWAGTAWANQNPPVEVPDVVGETQAAGTATLEGEGFVVAVVEAYSDSVALGSIVSQSPVGGSFAASGSTVTITVSLGPQPAASEHPAGRARRRKRFTVEIDGQDFDVNNVAEARALLERAKSLAEQAAAKDIPRQLKRAKRRKRAVRISAPVITTNAPELQPLVAKYSTDIGAIYKQMALDAEIRDLLRKKLLEEDEEDAITALLLH
jgi:hypothetical protein